MSDSRQPHSDYYRDKCMKQKINCCAACGTTDGRLVAHHINGDQTDNELENLIPLCDSCHRKVHSTKSHGRSIDRLTDELPASAFPLAQRMKIKEVEVGDKLFNTAESVAKGRNTTRMGAIRHMCQAGGYDV